MTAPESNDKDEREWGVIQKLHVEADTEKALRAVCDMAFTEHNHGAESYAVKDGTLHLYWSDSDGTKLPFVLDSPRKVYEFIRNWLDQATYGPEHDTDGSCKKGFCAENDYGYTFLKIKPEWIVYGK